MSFSDSAQYTHDLRKLLLNMCKTRISLLSLSLLWRGNSAELERRTYYPDVSANDPLLKLDGGAYHH